MKTPRQIKIAAGAATVGRRRSRERDAHSSPAERIRLLLRRAPASAVVVGMQWYVDSRRGNDANDGKGPETALKTLQQAAAKASAGDTVYLAPGGYDQDLPRQISMLRAANVVVAVLGADH